MTIAKPQHHPSQLRDDVRPCPADHESAGIPVIDHGHRHIALHPRRPLPARLQRAGDGAPTARSTPTSATTASSLAPATRRRSPTGDPNVVGHGRGLRRLRPGELVPGHPERRRPGDHPVVPPARDHPVDPTGRRRRRLATAERGQDCGTRRCRGSSAPAPADGHDADLVPRPDPRRDTGKINYDVDNDGDGIDRLGLARPGLSRRARRPRASSSSRCSPSWSSASTAGSR